MSFADRVDKINVDVHDAFNLMIQQFVVSGTYYKTKTRKKR